MTFPMRIPYILCLLVTELPVSQTKRWGSEEFKSRDDYKYNCFIPLGPNVSKFIAGVEDLDVGLHT